MQKIGLTGGIGSGKSTVARMLAERGFAVVDADELAREVVEPGRPALAQLVEAFGEGIVLADGSLNRGELARRAFSSQEGTELLNAVTHPAIRELTAERFAQAEAAGERWVVYDMPLLVDLGLHREMDLTVVVTVPEEVRIRRLVATRGMDEEDARARVAKQIPEQERLRAADVVIDNAGSPADLSEKVDALVARLQAE